MYEKVSKAVQEERCCEKEYKYVQSKSHCFSVCDRMGWANDIRDVERKSTKIQ